MGRYDWEGAHAGLQHMSNVLLPMLGGGYLDVHFIIILNVHINFIHLYTHYISQLKT